MPTELDKTLHHHRSLHRYAGHGDLQTSSEGFQQWGSPQMDDSSCRNGKSQSKMDDDWGVPVFYETSMQ